MARRKPTLAEGLAAGVEEADIVGMAGTLGEGLVRVSEAWLPKQKLAAECDNLAIQLFRDRVSMALGLRPVESFDPRAFRGAVLRSWLVFNAPAYRLEINPVGGCRLAPCPDPYATSGGYRREDWLR